MYGLFVVAWATIGWIDAFWKNGMRIECNIKKQKMRARTEYNKEQRNCCVAQVNPLPIGDVTNIQAS